MLKKLSKIVVLTGALLLGAGVATPTQEAQAWSDIIYKEDTHTIKKFDGLKKTKSSTTKVYTAKPKKFRVLVPKFENIKKKKGVAANLKVQVYQEKGTTDKLLKTWNLSEKTLESDADISPRTREFDISKIVDKKTKKAKLYVKFTYNFDHAKRVMSIQYN